ncbi:MAG: peptidoglycan editing factor PgeF [Rhizobiaceae bacterium]
MSTLSPVLAPQISTIEGVNHGFFTRKGGVSKGLYSGLNARLGSNDNPVHITKNRALISNHLGVLPDQLATPYQIHSSNIVFAQSPWPAERPQADGIVTNRPNIAIGILTADCGPVLFVDEKAGVIGAAHAGWKGALNGVLENTIIEMEKLGGSRKNIIAVLGPSISQTNYEVGPDFPAPFLQHSAENKRHFTQSNNAGHFRFDLSGYIVSRLKNAGVNATSLNRCTYAEDENFYSYRRATHQGESQYGCQLSAIVFNA